MEAGRPRGAREEVSHRFPRTGHRGHPRRTRLVPLLGRVLDDQRVQGSGRRRRAPQPGSGKRRSVQPERQVRPRPEAAAPEFNDFSDAVLLSASLPTTIYAVNSSGLRDSNFDATYYPPLFERTRKYGLMERKITKYNHLIERESITPIASRMAYLIRGREIRRSRITRE
ncbi:UNVERIFIED_CONTAM: hypothetical protein PYX00_006995 [Menopon gallinae]|uniref:Uncharacterized protein n=1 Tax=Menopon gallinae TaxID=328185 RepID=A0AAW2HHG5_9NEOP